MSSFNTDLNSPLSRRMTSIKTDSPSTLKLGDPISEQFKSKQNLSSETSEIKFNGKEYIFYILIFFLLAILGINIFVYLGILSENLISFFRPIIFNFAYYGSEAVKTTVDSAAEGSKLGIDVAAGTVTSAVNLGQKAGKSAYNDEDEELEETVINDENLKNTLNTKNKKKQSQKKVIIPDDSTSMTQQSKPSKKSGYCYIGEDRGFRSCINIKEGDVCMSGNIFPSQEICVNPSLREGSDNYYYRDSIKNNYNV